MFDHVQQESLLIVVLQLSCFNVYGDNNHALSWIRDVHNHEKQVFSQNGEDGVLEFIFDQIGTKSKVYVEFGTEDASQCNTRYFREEKAWDVGGSLLMDGNNENPDINLKKVMFWPNNILELFTKYQVRREFDLLSVDMDSYDWWILEKILEGGYRPRVIVIEYNSMINFNESKAILPPEDNKSWKMWDKFSRYQNSSILAVKYLMKRFGYSLVWCNLINCIGILNEALGASIDLSLDEICKYTSILKKNDLVLHRCDPLERPLAIITTEGKWENETDNSQGSLRLRCQLKEFERGRLFEIIPEQLKSEEWAIIKKSHPGLKYT